MADREAAGQARPSAALTPVQADFHALHDRLGVAIEQANAIRNEAVGFTEDIYGASPEPEEETANKREHGGVLGDVAERAEILIGILNDTHVRIIATRKRFTGGGHG